MIVWVERIRAVALVSGLLTCPLAEEAQENFIIATSKVLFTPMRVPRGVLNATVHLQGMLNNAD